MFSLPLSRVNVRVAPSSSTVTSHCACPGSTGAAGARVGDARREPLDPHLRLGEAARLQRVGHRLHHAVGAADEHRVDAVEIDPVREQRVGLGAVDPAVQELDVLRLARQHVDEVEARQVRVLERGELLLEHHGAGRAIAVEERELGARLGGQRRLDDRQQRRDAAAGREAEVAACAAGIERDVEVTDRRHHVQRVAGRQRLVRPGREHAARVALDGDPQACRPARRSRSSTSGGRPGRRWPRASSGAGPRRSGTLGQRPRDVEGDRDGVARLALDLGDRSGWNLLMTRGVAAGGTQ